MFCWHSTRRLQQEEWEFQAQAILGYKVSSSQVRSQKTSPLTKQKPKQIFPDPCSYFIWVTGLNLLPSLASPDSVCVLCPWWTFLLVRPCSVEILRNGLQFSLIFTAHSLAFLARSLFSTLTERIDSLSWPWTYELYLIKTYKVAMGIHSGSEFKKCEIVLLPPTWLYNMRMLFMWWKLRIVKCKLLFYQIFLSIRCHL